MKFKDHFSGQAARYSRYRPTYPATLFAFLASLAPDRERAWDCATGGGQAALGLADHFGEVMATDGSKYQIEHAQPHPSVHYSVGTAEKSGIARSSIDLTIVAQALHWFDFEGFYSEVRRVSKPGAVLAVWCYNLLRISEKVDAVVDRFYWDSVGAFWPPERRLLEARYTTIPFPFEKCTTPEFVMEARWTLAGLTGYLGTWSAVARYKKEKGHDPLPLIEDALCEAWGEAKTARQVVWPLHLEVGKV